MLDPEDPAPAGRIDRRRLAIVMLASRDYEAMEIALACHARFGPPDVPLFILQNSFGDYDSDRTLGVARRYAGLCPDRVQVIDSLGENAPYHGIRALLAQPAMAGFDHIFKVDDDAFPLAEGWLDRLICVWDEAIGRSGDRLAYVTPLINNNTWGFAQVLKIMALEESYFATAARVHRVGSGHPGAPFRTLPPETIETGACGTIWACPDIARWLHARTTLAPAAFVEACRGQAPCPVPAADRYSIGAILFRRGLWVAIDDGGRDDEHMLHQHCARGGLDIVCARDVPFVHLNYFSQRAENRDILDLARPVYADWTGLPWPIRGIATRDLEIEARLRYLEGFGPTGHGPGDAASRRRLGPPRLGARIEHALHSLLHRAGLRRKPPRRLGGS